MTPTPAVAAPVNSTVVRRGFRRQLLMGAMALAMVVLATLVLLKEVRLNEEVEARYQQALSIAQRALDADRLAPEQARQQARASQVPAAPGADNQARLDLGGARSELARISQEIDRLRERSGFLNQIARYTLSLSILLAISFGTVFGVLIWRSQMASRDVMAALDRMAREDGLTGITNRRALDEGLTIELARARRTGLQLTLVMLDLDYFKRYNDRRGHGAGDALLRNAAQAWRRQLRPTDLLARYGGEEFTLVLPSIDADAACQLIERLRPLVPDRQTFSAGVATWEQHESAEQLLARADRALLVAKKQGRNRTVVSGRESQMTLPLQTA